jgi:hypothetical protein
MAFVKINDKELSQVKELHDLLRAKDINTFSHTDCLRFLRDKRGVDAALTALEAHSKWRKENVDNIDVEAFSEEVDKVGLFFVGKSLSFKPLSTCSHFKRSFKSQRQMTDDR